jgi:hypothetical protein
LIEVSHDKSAFLNSRVFVGSLTPMESVSLSIDVHEIA